MWFGDAVGHDPCNGATEVSATAALVAEGIRVIAISTGAANNLNGTGQAKRIADATGGVFLSGASDSQVSDAILNGLSNLPVTVTPSVSCDAGVSASLSPASQTDVSGTTFTFSETYGVNAGTLAGTYVCTVKFLLNDLDGGPAFQETITINVPAPDLSMAKTGPALVTEGHNATYTLTATNLGPTTATGVTVTDPVPANSTFVSASAGCAQAAGLITCTAGTLAPGGSQAFTITLLAGSGASIVNIATVAGDSDRPEPREQHGDGDDHDQPQPGLHRRDDGARHPLAAQPQVRGRPDCRCDRPGRQSDHADDHRDHAGRTGQFHSRRRHVAGRHDRFGRGIQGAIRARRHG